MFALIVASAWGLNGSLAIAVEAPPEDEPPQRPDVEDQGVYLNFPGSDVATEPAGSAAADEPGALAAGSPGPLVVKYQSQRTAVSMDGNSTIMDFNASAAPITQTLPSAVAQAGRILVMTKRDESANNVIIKPSAGQSINHLAQVALYSKGDSISLYSDGSSWIELAGTRAHDTVFVTDFGAIPDDASDDAPAIRAAIRALPTTGGRLVFEGGLYLVGSVNEFGNMVDLNKNNVTIEGYGATVRATASSICVVRLNAHDVSLRNMRIDGNNKAICGVSVYGKSNINIRDVEIKNIDQSSTYYGGSNNAAIGISVGEPSHNVRIESNHIHDIIGQKNGVARAIYIASPTAAVAASDIVVTGNRIERIQSGSATLDSDGVHVQAGSKNAQVIISNNYFSDVEERAVKIQSPGVTVIGNIINNPYHNMTRHMHAGISVYANDTVVMGNTFSGGYAGHGVEVGNTLPLARVRIVGNSLQTDKPTGGSSTGGVTFVTPIQQAVVTSNVFTGWWYGVRIMTGGVGVSVQGNSFSNLHTTGVVASESAGTYSDISIVGNTFSKSGSALVSAALKGTRIVVEGNVGDTSTGANIFSSTTVNNVNTWSNFGTGMDAVGSVLRTDAHFAHPSLPGRAEVSVIAANTPAFMAFKNTSDTQPGTRLTSIGLELGSGGPSAPNAAIKWGGTNRVEIASDDTLVVTAGLDLQGTSLGTCSSTTRGTLKFVEGASGVADKLHVCLKLADGTYAWKAAAFS